MKLFEKECKPYPEGTPTLKSSEATDLLRSLNGWRIVDDKRLAKEFEFADFAATLEFVNRVGEVAENCDHHPDFWFTYGKARLELTTHSIGGLSENDFIVASRIDRL